MDVVIPVYKLIACSENYSKALGSLWKYYRDHLAWDNNENIIDFPVNGNTSFSFGLKIRSAIDGKLPTCAIADTKLYVPVVTSSTTINAELLKQLQTCFERTISCNKYKLQVTVQTWNWYFDYFIDQSF